MGLIILQLSYIRVKKHQGGMVSGAYPAITNTWLDTTHVTTWRWATLTQGFTQLQPTPTPATTFCSRSHGLKISNFFVFFLSLFSPILLSSFVSFYSFLSSRDLIHVEPRTTIALRVFLRTKFVNNDSYYRHVYLRK